MKIGDKVTLKTAKELHAEFGEDWRSKVSIEILLGMEHYLGNTLTLRSFIKRENSMSLLFSACGYYFSSDCIKDHFQDDNLLALLIR